MKSAEPDAIDARIEEQLEHWLERLMTLVNQPGISSQGIGMNEWAELVERLLSEAGFETRLMATDGFPIIYAEAPGRSDSTLLCSNHYDVQPPEPLDLSDSPPFEATRRNGKVFGRGVQDDRASSCLGSPPSARSETSPVIFPAASSS